jgi:hypothetical protein
MHPTIFACLLKEIYREFLLESTVDSTQNSTEDGGVISRLKIRSEGSGSKSRVGWQQDADPAVFPQTAKLSIEDGGPDLNFT